MIESMDQENSSSGHIARRGLVGRIARVFTPYWDTVALVGVLIFVTAGLGVVNPVLIRVVFDSALFPSSGEPDLNLLWVIAGVMAGVTVVTGGLGVVQTFYTNKMGQRVMRDLRDRLFTYLQSQPLSFFTGTRTGEIQSRVSNDVGGVQSVVTSTLSNILSNGVIFLSTLIAMLILSWQLTLVAMGTVPVFAMMTWFVGRRRRAVTAKAQESRAEMTAITQETLSVSGIMLSKLFGRQDQETDRFRQENQRLSDLVIRQEMTGQSFWAVMQIFFSVSPVAIYVLAGYLISGSGPEAVSAGTIVAFTTLQSRLYFPIGSLLRVSVELQSSLALFERIFGYLDIRPDIQDRDGAVDLSLEQASGRITFDNVRLSYSALAEEEVDTKPPDETDPQWALDRVSFDIEPGKLAAFVGPSGAGKTSISYLIPRLYDVTDGAVLIDGNDVRDIRLASLAELIGYVTQESYLFHSSIRNNIMYGNPEATQEEVESAAKAAFIHDRIMQLPDQYETVVGERGYRLSGGERQRLSIARVVLHQPKILILDEATSALDTASERYIQTALEPLMKGRTTIAIAHRLSTIIAADVIYVVDEGEIVEQGTHGELLAARGMYARLYEEQFGGGRVESHCEDGIVLADGTVVPIRSDVAEVAAS